MMGGMDLGNSLPSDSLHKFKTFLGMIVMVFGGYLVVQGYQILEEPRQESMHRLLAMRAQREFEIEQGASTTRPGVAREDAERIRAWLKSVEVGRKVAEDDAEVQYIVQHLLEAKRIATMLFWFGCPLCILGATICVWNLRVWERELQQPSDELLRHQLRRAKAEADLAELNLRRGSDASITPPEPANKSSTT